MISVEVLRGSSSLETISGEWEALVGDSFTAAFSQPAWLRARFEAIPCESTVFITARKGTQLVGVLPLGRFRADARGLYFSQVAPLGGGDYQPPVVVPEMVAEVLPALLDAALEHFGRSGVFWWPNIPITDPSLPVIREYLRARHMPFSESREGAPRLRLNGCDYSGAEKVWSSSHRVDVRRQRKRLAEKGPVSLWRPSSLAEAEPVLSEFFRVHDAKWLAQGFPGMFQNPANRLFFQAMMRQMLGRGLMFSTLRCGETDISYAVAFFAGGWIQWYRPTYRSEFQNYSPTKVHLALLVEEACSHGWQGLDFLLGEEPYKKVWSNEMMEVVSIHAGFSQWAPSYFWFTRGKPYVKKHLAMSYMRAQAWLQKRKSAPREGTAR